MTDSIGTIRYDRFSLSLTIIAAVLVFEIAFVLFSVFGAHSIGLFILEILGFIVLLNFYCVRIVLDDEVILISYGIGVLRKIVDIHSITSVSVVENTRFASWIFNPRAAQAVTLTSRDGGRITIATEDSTRILEIVSGRVRN